MKVQKVKEILMGLGIRAKKGLGQNFLMDDNILRIEVQTADISEKDVILEVGPGLGFLTEKLLLRGSKVIAVEKDKKIFEYLKNKLLPRYPNLELISDDIMKVNLTGFNKIVSNPPYNLSTPLTLQLSERNVDLAVLMYQDIFAERLSARLGSGSYSRISVVSQYYYDIEIIKKVSKNVFYPAPKVNSALVRLRKRDNKENLLDHSIFLSVVREAFKYRRKKLANAFKNAEESYLNQSLIIPEMKEFLDKRAEELSIKDYVEISNLLHINKNDRSIDTN